MCCLAIDALVLSMIQAPKNWSFDSCAMNSVTANGALSNRCPNKPHGVPRVDDRRVLNGIVWVLRSGALWRDLPEIYRPCTTCYNRFVRWQRAGVWDKIMEALAAAYEAAVAHGPFAWWIDQQGSCRC